MQPKRLLTVAVVAGLVAAAPAAAQSPTTRGYDESGVLGATTGEDGVLGAGSGDSGSVAGSGGSTAPSSSGAVSGGQGGSVPGPEGGVLGKGYDESGVLGTIADERSRRSNGASRGRNAGDDLPFTGFEAGLVALMGAALIGTGFALRRSSRRAPAA